MGLVVQPTVYWAYGVHLIEGRTGMALILGTIGCALAILAHGKIAVMWERLRELEDEVERMRRAWRQ